MIKFCIAVLIVVVVISGESVSAQDPQFSQFYAAPLYLNPAFSGATGQARAGLNYRNQWPSIPASFVTSAAYFDYYFDEYNSGVGMLISTDREGLAGLRSTSINLTYAYQLRINDYLTVRPGISAGYVIRNIDFSRLTFGDQFDPISGEVILPVTNEAINFNNVNYLDLGAGALVYTENFWVGFSAHHLNTPDQAFTGTTESTLATKYSIHGGYKIKLPKVSYTKGQIPTRRERSITPTFQYKTQGEFDQLDIGTYVTLEPVVFGLTYRGLPVKTLNGFPNNESIIFLVGMTYNGLNVGYSFDYTISDLGISSGGAHEISVSYVFSLDDKRKPPKNVRQIPCPKF